MGKTPQTTSVYVFLHGIFIIIIINLILIMKYPFTEICDQKWGSWEISGSMCSGRWQISDDSSVGGHDWFQTLGCIAFNENQWLAVSVLITEDVLTATSCLDCFLFFCLGSLMFVWILSLRFLFWWPRVSMTQAHDIQPVIDSDCRLRFGPPQ